MALDPVSIPVPATVGTAGAWVPLSTRGNGPRTFDLTSAVGVSVQLETSGDGTNAAPLHMLSSSGSFTTDNRSAYVRAKRSAGEGSAVLFLSLPTPDGDIGGDITAVNMTLTGDVVAESFTTDGPMTCDVFTSTTATANEASFTTCSAGVLQCATLGSNTAGPLTVGLAGQQLAFNGATPIAKPAITGAKAGNTAVAGIIAQLVALGLVTDSTT